MLLTFFIEVKITLNRTAITLNNIFNEAIARNKRHKNNIFANGYHILFTILRRFIAV